MNRMLTLAAALALPAVVLAGPAQATTETEDTALRHAPCGSPAPGNIDPASDVTGGAAGAHIRTGSSRSCTGRGAIQPSHRLDYYCFTAENDEHTWTYLRNVTTNVQGWVRDDLLPDSGSLYAC